MGPRRRSQGYEVLGVRELTAEDVKGLRRAKLPAVKRLRHAHHKLAWLVATGRQVHEIAILTGYSESRINVLKLDPAFQELVATKFALSEAVDADSLADFNNLILTNGIKAEQLIADKLDAALDAEDDDIPWAVLLKASRDAADRVGLAKRSVALNVNVDFASQLQKAVQRSRLKVIEGIPTTAAPTTVVRAEASVETREGVASPSPQPVLVHDRLPVVKPEGEALVPPTRAPPLSVSRRRA